MKYLEWNNCIASYFFNPQNAGKDTYLYITKADIIDLGAEQMKSSTSATIWNDFISNVKSGLPGSNAHPFIFEKAIHAFQQWSRPNIKSIEGIELLFPPYIAYLLFTVLPLTEIKGDYNANNYYDRLDDFLKENAIIQPLRNKLKTMEDLWEDLSHWANDLKKGELGLFKTANFSHKTWRYVGKPFSQCVLPPKAIKKLPEMFVASGMTPNALYQDDTFKNQLIKNGISILGLKPNVVELIKKGPDDEIGQSIIHTVKSEYNKWTGELHETVLKDGKEKIIRKNTVIPLKLQFKINNDGEIDFSYRAKYSTEPPIDLKLDEFENIYENKNWSRTLKRPYKESFDMKDTFNKWIAKFESKNIRLLISGGYFNFSRDFWIETESLSRTEKMYILCKQEIKNSVQSWCETCCSDFNDESDLERIPPNHSLFSFRNPIKSHEYFQQLRVYQDKQISINSGLKIGYRTYLNDLLPDIKIENADGEEIVILQYEDSLEELILQKHPDFSNVWLLPKHIKVNRTFLIQIKNEFIDGPKQFLMICESECSDLNNDSIPKRNKFHHIAQQDQTFIQGNRIISSTKINIAVDGQSFNSLSTGVNETQTHISFQENVLLKWLVAVKTTDIQKYNESFETVLLNIFPRDNLEIQRNRKSAINFFDYLGYVDYDYENNTIHCLPPRLILIPNNRGGKALLIGGRDESLVSKIISYCAKPKSKIFISIIKQNKPYAKLLLPDSIILENNDRQEFSKIAKYLGIEFDEWYILKLKNFIPTLQEYEAFFLKNCSSESWERFGLNRKIFNRATLRFTEENTLDKSYSLVQYTITAYKLEFGLWINNTYFSVDKNWGKYLVISHIAPKERGFGRTFFSKPREIFSNSNSLAIPGSLPLPKIFSRMLLQLSGQAPEFKELNLKGIKLWYNVYKNIPSLFIENFFRSILNMNIEKTLINI